MSLSNDGRWGIPEAEAAVIIGSDVAPSSSAMDGLSPYEYLLRALESHISSERDALSHYRQLAEQTKDPIVELVMGLILEDEERHHALMRRIAARLQDDLNWTHSAEALPKSAVGPSSAEAQDLLRQGALARCYTEVVVGRDVGAAGRIRVRARTLLGLDAIRSERHHARAERFDRSSLGRQRRHGHVNRRRTQIGRAHV